MLFASLAWLLLTLMVLLSVAFFTLFERKVMGLVHLRPGPNKVLFFGLIQPLLDAFKLLSKSYVSSHFSNKLFYHASPYAALFLSILMWLSVPTLFSTMHVSFSALIFMVVGSFMVFPNLLSGWSSNSKYSFIGSLRSVAQSISYESVFFTLAILVLLIYFTYNFKSTGQMWSAVILYIFPTWLFSVLAETHRAPFDFSESESELVSGFNTEYYGPLFAFIFLSEYSALLVACAIMTTLFFPFHFSSVLLSVLLILLVSALVVYIRVTYCRFRYDLLMSAAWKSFLPVVIFQLMLFLCLL